jgi:hypothetical protein
MLEPGLLDFVQLAVLNQSLDVVICLPAASLSGSEHERTAAPIEMYSAGATPFDAAPVFCAGESNAVAQYPKQVGTGISVNVVDRPIYAESYH